MTDAGLSKTHHGNPMSTSEGGNPMDPHTQEPSSEDEDAGLTVIEVNETIEIESAPVSKM